MACDQKLFLISNVTVTCCCPEQYHLPVLLDKIRIDQNRFEFSDARHCRPLPAGLIYIQRQGHELVAMLPGSQVGVWQNWQIGLGNQNRPGPQSFSSNHMSAKLSRPSTVFAALVLYHSVRVLQLFRLLLHLTSQRLHLRKSSLHLHNVGTPLHPTTTCHKFVLSAVLSVVL